MTTGLRGLVIGSVAAALVATPLAAAADPAGPAPAQTRVAVSVATLWASPESPRSIDAKAVRAPARPAKWLRSMSVWERRGLYGRVESQALYGQPVDVLERREGWARVVLPLQPSPKSPDGYPGWIPEAQLAQAPDVTAGAEAIVTKRKAWAFQDKARTARVVKLSYGTRLPVVRTRKRAVAVAGPEGRTLWLSAKRVAVGAPGAAARPATRSAVVAEARKFLGLAYLWGGTSGFGFDCSGFTHTIYAQLGITIPRDATPQFDAGTAVTTVSELRRGDLVFFRASSGSIHHVGIYVGRGQMIHSPRTGQPVQVSSITSGIWAREFAGGRRYL
jgi:cell wall-associated NlpC family hydrolase